MTGRNFENEGLNGKGSGHLIRYPKNRMILLTMLPSSRMK